MGEQPSSGLYNHDDWHGKHYDDDHDATAQVCPVLTGLMGRKRDGLVGLKIWPSKVIFQSQLTLVVMAQPGEGDVISQRLPPIATHPGRGRSRESTDGGSKTSLGVAIYREEETTCKG